MADTLELSITQQVIDENSQVVNEQNYEIAKGFSASQIGTVSIPTGTTNTPITFVKITTATYMRIKTDKIISVRLNAGVEDITITTDLIITGSITGLTITNASGYTATIDYDLRA